MKLRRKQPIQGKDGKFYESAPMAARYQPAMIEREVVERSGAGTGSRTLATLIILALIAAVILFGFFFNITITHQANHSFQLWPFTR